MASLITGFGWGLSALKDELVFSISEKEGQYVEKMGGNMKSLYQDLESTADFLGGEEFFSTYASGQEVVEGKYQPSGTDYIIHVLGDEERERYLEAFRSENYKYTATIKDTFTYWEYWVQRANWFFYKELYQNWHPVYANSYEMYWERNKEGESNFVSAEKAGVTLELITLDEATMKIRIKAKEDLNGVADFHLDYKVQEKNSIRAELLCNKMLHTANTGSVFAEKAQHETNYLRGEGADSIPVTIVDGYGEVTLTSCPKSDTYLELHSAECMDIYTVPFNYLEVEGINDYKGKVALYVPATAKNKEVVNNATEFVVGSETVTCSVVEENGNLYLVDESSQFTIDNLTSEIRHNNMVLIKKEGSDT